MQSLKFVGMATIDGVEHARFLIKNETTYNAASWAWVECGGKETPVRMETIWNSDRGYSEQAEFGIQLTTLNRLSDGRPFRVRVEIAHSLRDFEVRIRNALNGIVPTRFLPGE